MPQHAVHSSTLMDHVLLLVLLTMQPVVIPTTFVVSQCTCTCTIHYSALFRMFFLLSPGHELNSSCSGCIPVHICLTSNPCQNGATCNIGSNSNTDYTCSCPANYTGQNCESEYKC